MVVIVVGLEVLIIVGFGDDDVINITNTIVEVVSNIYTNNMIKPIASDFILSLNDTVYIFWWPNRHMNPKITICIAKCVLGISAVGTITKLLLLSI